jgi:hypothetical protein
MQALATQKPFDGFAVHWESAVHSTHCPAAVPVVAQVVLPSVRPAQPVAPGAVQPVQAFATQKPLAGFAVHWLSAAHSTHWPEDVPVVAQTILPSTREEHPVAPVVLQPVQALATQKPFVGSVVHWVSATQATHWPVAVPVVAQVVLPSVRAAQPVAPAVLHPVHEPATQNPFVGSMAHWASARHATHCPTAVPVVAQVVLPSVRAAQPVAPAVLHPVHEPATQNPFVGFTVH